MLMSKKYVLFCTLKCTLTVLPLFGTYIYSHEVHFHLFYSACEACMVDCYYFKTPSNPALYVSSTAEHKRFLSPFQTCAPFH